MSLSHYLERPSVAAVAARALFERGGCYGNDCSSFGDRLFAGPAGGDSSNYMMRDILPLLQFASHLLGA